MRIIILLIALVCVFPAFAADTGRLEWQGIDRLFRLHNQQVGPAPTVFYLHHLHSEAGAVEARADLSLLAWDHLDALAETEEFVTVTPAAIKGFWNHSEGLGEIVRHPEVGEVEDLGFIFALADHLVSSGVTDPERLYVSGISNGAIMSYRLLCSERNPFTAAAYSSPA